MFILFILYHYSMQKKISTRNATDTQVAMYLDLYSTTHYKHKKIAMSIYDMLS